MSKQLPQTQVFIVFYEFKLRDRLPSVVHPNH
jgi:hypothetical protein